jgi:hypothetical protein
MTKDQPLSPGATILAERFLRDGWVVLPQDARVCDWVKSAVLQAHAVLADPDLRETWLRHDQTWFAGVDAFPNAPDGSISGVRLAGLWEDLIRLPDRWHQGQLSVIYPGYPGRDPQENEAAHRFRRDRDAAHLDGLLAVGPDKRRFLREPHAFILGLPLGPVTTEAGAFVVWDQSHRLIAQVFREAFAGVEPAHHHMLDLTDVYQAARKRVFAELPRRVVVAAPGEAILVHRMAIHGSAPWPGPRKPESEGRMIVWFRPVLPSVADWLSDDGPL